MAFAPTLYPLDVVINLYTPFPRQEVFPLKKIIEGSNPDKLQQLGDSLRSNRFLNEVSLQGLMDFAEQSQEIVYNTGFWGA